MRGEYNIGSVDKALSVLRVFSQERPEMNITEISKELGFTYSTTFRLVATLEVNSFLYKNPGNQKYSLGPAIRTLNSNYIEHFAFKETAIPFLDTITKRFGETTVLYVVKSVKNNSRICIARTESHHTLRPSVNVNDELELTKGSIGHVLVSNLPPKDQEYLMKLDPDLNPEELKRTKEDGYSFKDGGRVEGIAGTSVPLLDNEGKVIAAIGVTGASYRFEKIDLKECIEYLKKCSGEITGILCGDK